MSRIPKHLTMPGTQAERMIRLRLALGFTSQTEFAMKHGFTVTQWNNFERGLPVSMRAAQQLVQRVPGLSIGWIIEGKTGDLSVTMARMLAELPPESGVPS